MRAATGAHCELRGRIAEEKNQRVDVCLQQSLRSRHEANGRAKK
jgi:hypothetical protein